MLHVVAMQSWRVRGTLMAVACCHVTSIKLSSFGRINHFCAQSYLLVFSVQCRVINVVTAVECVSCNVCITFVLLLTSRLYFMFADILFFKIVNDIYDENGIIALISTMAECSFICEHI